MTTLPVPLTRALSCIVGYVGTSLIVRLLELCEGAIRVLVMSLFLFIFAVLTLKRQKHKKKRAEFWVHVIFLVAVVEFCTSIHGAS